MERYCAVMCPFQKAVKPSSVAIVLSMPVRDLYLAEDLLST
jgi:hypothetical protein